MSAGAWGAMSGQSVGGMALPSRPRGYLLSGHFGFDSGHHWHV